MRKIFTWVILVLTVAVANAQETQLLPESIQRDVDLAKRIIDTDSYKGNANHVYKAETDVSSRVFWVDDWSITNTFEGNDYRTVFTVFPDKAQGLYWDADSLKEDGPNEINWNSVGISFDPKDNTWFDRDLSRIRDWHNYTIDSVFFTYAYLRRTHDSIIDKIILQTYKGSQLLRRANSGAIGNSATVGYNSTKGEGTNFHDSIHLTLTADDTSTQVRSEGTFFSGTTGIAMKEPIEMTAGEIFGVTINFEPGFEYDKGGDDTLYIDSRLLNKYDTLEKSPMNTLFVTGRLQSDYNDLQSPVTPLTSYNNGMFISRRISGSTRPTRYANGSYIYPGEVPVVFYPRIGVRINAKFDVGLAEKDLRDGFGLGELYPNPAKSGTELNLSFAVDGNERVNISIFDLSGKKVMEVVDGKYEAGKHRLTFQANDLESGLYLYTMTAGSYSKTQRFSITD